MKNVVTTSSAAKPRKALGPATQPTYLSSAQTKALLSGSLAYRMERLSADDMVSTDEAATLTGTTRVTINAWIAKGRAIGLTQTRRGFRLPRWQFEPKLWEAIPELAKALQTTDGWTILSFLETPQGSLEGGTPRQAIEQGKVARVVELAGAEGT